MNTDIFKDPELSSRFLSSGFPSYLINEAPLLPKEYLDIMHRSIKKILEGSIILVTGSDDIYKDVFMVLLGYHLSKKFRGKLLKYVDSFSSEPMGNIIVMPCVDELGIAKAQYFIEYTKKNVSVGAIILIGTYEVSSFLAFVGEPYIEKYSKKIKVIALPKVSTNISLEEL